MWKGLVRVDNSNSIFQFQKPGLDVVVNGNIYNTGSSYKTKDTNSKHKFGIPDTRTVQGFVCTKYVKVGRKE